MRTPIVLALIIILAPYGSSTEGTKIIDHSGDSILEDLSPVVQSAFNRAMSDDSDFEAHRGLGSYYRIVVLRSLHKRFQPVN